MRSASLGLASFNSSRASPSSRASAATSVKKGSEKTLPSAAMRAMTEADPSPIQPGSSRPSESAKSRAALGWRKVRLPSPRAFGRSNTPLASSRASSSAISALSDSASAVPLPRRRSETGSAASPAGRLSASLSSGGRALAMGAAISSAASARLGAAPRLTLPEADRLALPCRAEKRCSESRPASSVASSATPSKPCPCHSTLPAVRRRLASKPCSASVASCQERLSETTPSSDSASMESPSPSAGLAPSRKAPAPA